MVSWLVWRVSVLILNLFFLFDTRCHKFYGAPTLLAKTLSSLAFCLVTINVTACLESHPNGKLPTKSLIVIWTMCLMLIRQHRICVVVAGGGMRETTSQWSPWQRTPPKARVWDPFEIWLFHFVLLFNLCSHAKRHRQNVPFMSF